MGIAAPTGGGVGGNSDMANAIRISQSIGGSKDRPPVDPSGYRSGDLPILTETERERMRALLRELWGSWHTWLFLGFLSLSLVSLVWLASSLQHQTYQHDLEVQTVRTVEQIKKELELIRMQNDASIKDRTQIHRALEKIDSSSDQ